MNAAVPTPTVINLALRRNATPAARCVVLRSGVASGVNCGEPCGTAAPAARATTTPTPIVRRISAGR